MLNQSHFEPGTTQPQQSATHPPPVQPQRHLPGSNPIVPVSLRPVTPTANPWNAQVSVKLSGRLASAPRFGVGATSSNRAEGVELDFLFEPNTSSPDRSGKGLPGKPGTGPTSTAPVSVSVWCDGWQFAKVAKELSPQTRLAVEGQPLLAVGPNGEPKLRIICTGLKIARPIGRFSWSTAQTRLGLVWLVIFGLIGVLQVLLPRLMPPGLLPLAIVLGGLRAVEGARFMPEGIKTFVHGWQVKILILAAFLMAVWFFVLFGYYTTPRFR